MRRGLGVIALGAVLTVVTVSWCGQPDRTSSLDQVDFGRAVIVSARPQPHSVPPDVGELVSTIQLLYDRKPGLVFLWDETLWKEGPTAVVIVGKEPLTKAPPDVPRFSMPDDELGGEGFVIKTAFRGEEPQPFFFLAGNTPQGTKLAVTEFERLLRFSRAGKKIAIPLDVRETPYFARRAMYGHLHWAYNYPYACRSWSAWDWKRYVDLLSHMKLNMLQIWTMVGILPHPLSDEDRRYLEKYREVVDYAHERRGMTIWLGDCANNVAETNKGMPIEKREYFEVEVLKNPGDPKQFRQIMDSREDLYRTLPDGDAYWIIDSDPCVWKGSPASDLVDVFVGHRKLMDRFCERPDEQAIVYWMWWGWGTKSQKENWRDVVLGLKQKLREPWYLSACNLGHIALLKELGLTHKTLCFPYGAVEHEPSPPMTVFQEDYIREAARVAKQEKLMGLMGNSQTPAVQLPDIYLLSRLAWNPDDPASFDEILDDLSMQLDPRNPLALGKAWKALKGNDPAAMLEAREGLNRAGEDRSRKREPDGGLAWYVPGGIATLHADLRALLTIKASALHIAELAENAPEDELKGALFEYFDALLTWTERTGYHNNFLVYGPYRDILVRAWKAICESQGDPHARMKIAQPVHTLLLDKHRRELVNEIVEGLLGKISSEK